MSDRFRGEKDPQATLDYTIDWSAWLATGDTISSSSFAVESPAGDASPVSVTQQSALSAQATVWLTGGTAGNQYRVINTITTTQGRTDQRTLTITVKQK
jgi:hypothetical protein